MTSQNSMRRRSGAFVTGSLIALASLAGLAAAPAHAQDVQETDPGFVPVVGTWTRGGNDTVAWIDMATWTLATSFEGSQPSEGPEPQSWRPVAGDWDGDGVDSVQMFNIYDWRLAPAELGPVGETSVGDPVPWIPVAGDWDGDGIDTVLVFDQRDETLRRLEEGPIPVEGYDPQPQLWQPAAGDWDGRGIDTVASYRNEATTPASAPIWVTVFGDWDGDGIDSAAALHMPTGELVQPAQAEAGARVAAPRVSSTFAEALQLPNGCYMTVKNKTSWTLTTPYPSKCTYEGSMWEQWFCCPISSTGGRYNCSVTLQSTVKQSC